MIASDQGKLQSILISAIRCLDCRDSRCVSACPEHVDIRAAMQVIAARAPQDIRRAWITHPDEATISAMDGIESSFES